MLLSKIHLSNFRNFSDKLVGFFPDTTVIVGPNATGKTNVLESIYLLSTGKSFKAKVEEEMLGYDDEIARVKGLVTGSEQIVVGGGSEAQVVGDKAQTTKLEVVLTRGEITVGTSPEKIQKTARKKLLVNGVSKRLLDFAGILKVVVFGPQDLDLVTESPSIRRYFLDAVLSQVDREYRRASLSYGKGLRQRNKLLLRIREDGSPRTQLMFWDKLLIKNGNYISQKREQFMDFVNSYPDLTDRSFNLIYDKSSISETRLEQYKNEEVAAGTTLVGPHRDDFIFQIKGDRSKNKRNRELARYGSRGEQRMGVLWLKLNELLFIKEQSGEQPVLLLDDIFSELDHEHRDIVMGACSNQQTIITTADPHYLEGLKNLDKIQL